MNSTCTRQSSTKQEHALQVEEQDLLTETNTWHFTRAGQIREKTPPRPHGFADIDRRVKLPNSTSIDPAVLRALTLIGEVARGTDDIGSRPEARMHDPTTMQAGCLKNHAEVWEHYILPNTNHSETTKASIMKQVREGIDWTEYANKDAFSKKNTRTHHEKNHTVSGFLHDGITTQAQFVTDTLAGYVAMNALKLVPKGAAQPQVISPLFVDTSRPKARLITDCRWQNKRQSPPKFKLQTLGEFKRAILPGSLMFKIDLVAGFLHVGIAEASQSVFGIKWNEQTYAFTAANFGANTTPFIFQRLTASVGQLLQRLGISNCVYLDDMLFVCLPATDTRNAEQRAADTIFIVKEVLYLCGFVVHPTKSVFIPMTRIESLGFGVDSVLQTFWVLEHRRDSIADIAALLHTKTSVTINEMQRFTGKAVSLTLAAPAIRLYLGPLWDSFSSARHDAIPLTPLLHAAIAEFTRENIDLWGKLARWIPEDHENYTCVDSDAAGGTSMTERLSGNGWGCAIYRPHNPSPVILQGRFEPQHHDCAICIKECLATLYALRAAGLHDCFATVRTDNKNVYYAMKKFSTKSIEFRPFVQACIEFQIHNNVVLTFEWIPTAENAVADEASRSNAVITDDSPSDPADVQLHPSIFARAHEWAGFNCTLDALASPTNRQTRLFIDRRPHEHPDCVATDVFASAATLRGTNSATDEQQRLWVHAPWPIISALWSFLRASKTRGIFIAPHFPQEAWFNRVTHEACRMTRIVCDKDEHVYNVPARGGKPDTVAPATVDLYALVFDFT